MKNKSCFTGILDVNKIMSFPKFVVGNLLLSGSLLKEEKKTLFYAESGRSPNPAGRHPSGMTPDFTSGLHPTYNGAGFTLIELLVVVLIIGILASVALPQYKLAVAKARVATILPIIKAISQAKQTYFLANGTYTADVSLLDVDLPNDCQKTNPGNASWKCGEYFVFSQSDGGITSVMSYCPGYNSAYGSCDPKRDFSIANNISTPNNPWSCSGVTSLGQKVCNSLHLN